MNWVFFQVSIAVLLDNFLTASNDIKAAERLKVIQEHQAQKQARNLVVKSRCVTMLSDVVLVYLYLVPLPRPPPPLPPGPSSPLKREFSFAIF